MKIDYKKELKHLYRATPERVVEVDVPEMRFLMVDGRGDPDASGPYGDAVAALFAVSYTAKFMLKKGPAVIADVRKKKTPPAMSRSKTLG